MRPWLVLLILLTGCEPATPWLVVDMRTDWVGGVEFHAAEVSVDGAEPTVVFVQEPREGLVEGVRLAEYAEMGEGRHEVLVRLTRGSQLVAQRRLAVELVEPTVVTALFTRSCRDVTCPDGDESLTECVGGRCVAPECTPENPEACPAAACAADEECSAGSVCGAAVCVDGVCLEDDAGTCAAGEFCHPSLECSPLGSGACPPYTLAVGDTFCIDIYQSGSMIWLDAQAFCESRGGSLCSEEQWVEACESSESMIDALIDDYEWTSLLVDEDNALKHGAGDCATTSPHSIHMDEYGVRCCHPR